MHARGGVDSEMPQGISGGVVCARSARACQSVSQLGCCCLTMAVLSADVLRWHVSFYISFYFENNKNKTTKHYLYLHYISAFPFFYLKKNRSLKSQEWSFLFVGYFPQRR